MQKKHLDGTTWFPLTVQNQILDMRKEIESNAQHAGQKFEIVKQAYDEIQEAHGLPKSKYTASCSGCILQINQIILNWFKLYDQLGPSKQRILKAPKFQPLKPAVEPSPAEASSAEPSYKELLENFNEVATEEEKAKMKAEQKGKTPSKKQLTDYFDGKQEQTAGTQE